MLRREAVVRAPAGGPVVVEAPWARITLGVVGPGVRSALVQLAGDGATERALADLVIASDGPAALPTLYFALHRAAAHRLVGATAGFGGRRVVTALPMTDAPVPTPVPLGAEARVRLSRFAFARRGEGDGTLVVETPLTPIRVLLHGECGGALLAVLAEPIGIADLTTATPDEAAAVLGLLVAAGVAGITDADGVIATEETPALRRWELHDLVFHTRSRHGRHDLPYGGTYPFRDEQAPLPALKPVTAERCVALPRAATGPTPGFDDVLAARRSARPTAPGA